MPPRRGHGLRRPHLRRGNPPRLPLPRRQRRNLPPLSPGLWIPDPGLWRPQSGFHGLAHAQCGRPAAAGTSPPASPGARSRPPAPDPSPATATPPGAFPPAGFPGTPPPRPAPAPRPPPAARSGRRTGAGFPRRPIAAGRTKPLHRHPPRLPPRHLHQIPRHPLPCSCPTRARRAPSPSTAAASKTTRPSFRNTNRVPAAASACSRTWCSTCAASVPSPFRNFRRAGTLKNKSATVTTVPHRAPRLPARPAASRPPPPPPSRSPLPSSRVASRNLDTLAMLGTAVPPEPQRPHRRQVPRLRQLARRVPLQGEQRVVPPHPAPVVLHPDHRHPRPAGSPPPPAVLRVQAVLHQLLHHARRALHHLPRRHLARKGVRQNMNPRHQDNFKFQISNFKSKLPRAPHHRHPRLRRPAASPSSLKSGSSSPATPSPTSATAPAAPTAPSPPGKSKPGVLRIADHLVDTRRAQLLVVACNSATIHAVEALRAHLPHPVTGMEPAVKPAARLTRTGTIGILATQAAIAGEKFHRLLDLHAKEIRALTRPAPLLVDLVEEGDLTSARAPRNRRLLRPPPRRGRRRRPRPRLHPLPLPPPPRRGNRRLRRPGHRQPEPPSPARSKGSSPKPQSANSPTHRPTNSPSKPPAPSPSSKSSSPSSAPTSPPAPPCGRRNSKS